MSEQVKIRSYRDLKIWSLGMDICSDIYAVTKKL